ncbi:uncharacterized protein LY79DRAFT_537849 [Colletotrichum navitas]|uniref:Uncharacterized protein n=1 Tax=Colletotrichum navitas TaxID=681940 RepID=A0AAD8QCU6_9PEZI|nr:uncharacterized protein LY79DRAFT_537849 [Colletotrichum navitas]KAK1598679.1 hypothetical protein LY79DRAFT_537849 [Colletotrichum navitas]
MASHPCPNAYSHSRPYLVHAHHRHQEPLPPLHPSTALRCASTHQSRRPFPWENGTWMVTDARGTYSCS